MRHDFISNSPEETYSFGKHIGSRLSGGEIIGLNGELGAGKTLLTKGIVNGMDPETTATVVSPSFTLVNLYNARLDIIHVDLYRLDSEEIGNLGLEDFMDTDHVIIVEWAQRACDFSLGTNIDITIDHAGEHKREITISTQLPWISDLTNLQG